MNDQQFVQIQRRAKFTESEFWEMLNALNPQVWENLYPPQFLIEDLPGERASSFVTPADAPVPDCLTCGKCCMFMFTVGVLPTDKTPPENVWHVMDESGEVVVDSYLRRSTETLFCAALEVKPDGTKPCRIYERRPQICRKFEAGSDKCHAVRRLYGLEPFLTIQEMLDAQAVLQAGAAKENSAETIRDVRIVKQDDADSFEIIVEMQDGSLQTIHNFEPNIESWRQFQFRGATLDAARELIESPHNAAETD